MSSVFKSVFCWVTSVQVSKYNLVPEAVTTVSLQLVGLKLASAGLMMMASFSLPFSVMVSWKLPFLTSATKLSTLANPTATAVLAVVFAPLRSASPRVFF